VTDPSAERADQESREPIDTAQMWENLCLADELSEDCLALEQGLAAQRGAARPPDRP
jgi:hypothetical protein